MAAGGGMKEWFIAITEYAILAINALAVLVIVAAALEAFVRSVHAAAGSADDRQKQEIWLGFARWLVAGLTFQLAADILETSITTSWEAIGRIAAIAVIRTLLNFFLDRDLAAVSAHKRAAD
jgi:uncharacterized membrane protein